MRHVERFAFQGTASLLSGRVHRPKAMWIDVGAASALPVEGGVSSATFAATDVGRVIGFGRGSTHAQGDADEKPVLRGARTRAPECTHAHTGAEVRNLTVGGRTKMTARRIRAEITALCPLHAQQPSIGAFDGAMFEGVAFGRHRLSVSIDRRFFKTHDTHEKLCAVCATHARGLPRAVLRSPTPRADQHDGTRGSARRHAEAYTGAAEPVLTTIVKRLRWIGRPFPNASLDGHVATIPGFGRAYFGEMLVHGHTRRLTMIRFDLDGDVSLDAACCEVEAGGAWCR